MSRSPEDKIARIMHQAHVNYQRKALGTDVDSEQQRIRRGHHRVAPKPNMSQFMLDHLTLDYYKVFCDHDKLRIEDCKKCGRKGLIALK
jgi:hypothetical protein